MTGISSFTQATRDEAEAYLDTEPPAGIDPRIEPLVNGIIGRVADKWTMLMLEALHENGVMRFSEIGRAVDGISQKMLTQTLRQMEREGLVTRTVYPVVPPRVEYALTDLGRSLGQAFCGVWIWAERHVDEIEAARAAFDARTEEEAEAKR